MSTHWMFREPRAEVKKKVIVWAACVCGCGYQFKASGKRKYAPGCGDVGRLKANARYQKKKANGQAGKV